THLASHGAKTSVWSHSVAVEAAAMGGHTATYDKMETSRSVRRPESGTWQSGSNGRRYRGPRSHCGTSSSVTRLGYGGPWPIWGLAAPMGGL
ncbi:unnamed protein product, partial [Staurois parvus]